MNLERLITDRSRRWAAHAITLTLISALAACGGEENNSTENNAAENNGASNNTSTNNTSANNASQPLEVIGQWASVYGLEEISGEVWGDAELIAYDNEANWAITRNAEDAEYFPGRYSKIVWTEPAEGRFFYCTAAFDLESEQDARDAEGVADDSDPVSGGCGESDFPWSELEDNATFELIGEWTGEFGDETITQEDWTSYSTVSLIGYNNAANVAVTQNPASDESFPEKFSKVVWLGPEDDTFYYCVVDFGLDAAEDAWASEATADPTDPDNGGCGESFPWTKLTVKP